MSKLPTPTDSELEILAVLWRRGPSTVRDVFEAIAARRRAGYTTILKLMQIMHGKRLVTRDERQRSHVYAAAIAEDKTQRNLLRELLDRAFGGSKQKLLMSALDATRATPDELEAVRALLDAQRK